MVEKIGHVKNPLTVIAIFAGIAEISGTIVLPLISPSVQSIYVWFLMLFPSILVILFFATLNYNPTALYSPSDYRDENNFVNSVRRATPEEVSKKLRQEVKEVEAEINKVEPDEGFEKEPNPEIPSKQDAPADEPLKEPESENSGSGTTRQHEVKYSVYDHEPVSSTNHTRVLSDLALAETLAIGKLTNTLNIPFERNLSITVPGKRKNVTFDGFAVVDDTVHLAEVKYFARSNIDISRFYSSMVDAAYLGESLSIYKKQRLVLHIFIVAEVSPAQKSKKSVELLEFAKTIGLAIEIHVSPLNELANAA